MGSICPGRVRSSAPRGSARRTMKRAWRADRLAGRAIVPRSRRSVQAAALAGGRRRYARHGPRRRSAWHLYRTARSAAAEQRDPVRHARVQQAATHVRGLRLSPVESGEWCVGLVVAFSAFCSVATLGCTLNNCRDGTVFAPIAIAEVDPGILTGRAPEPVGDVTPVVTEGYPPFMPLYYSLDTVMAFIPFGIENQWAPNADFQTWFETPIKLGSWGIHMAFRHGTSAHFARLDRRASRRRPSRCRGDGLHRHSHARRSVERLVMTIIPHSMIRECRPANKDACARSSFGRAL